MVAFREESKLDIREAMFPKNCCNGVHMYSGGGARRSLLTLKTLGGGQGVKYTPPNFVGLFLQNQKSD